MNLQSSWFIQLISVIASFSNQGKEDEVNALKQDSVRLTRQREAIQRKLRTIEDQKVETEHQKETLKNQINALEKGMGVS